MWWSSDTRVWAVGVLGVIAGLALYAAGYHVALAVSPAFRAEVSIAPCHAEQDGDQQIECVFRSIRKELHRNGVGAAFEVFSAGYRTFPAFVASACHVQAHRVGDLAYYEIYTGTKSLDSIDLPQTTTACGYGFYHGLLEHLIQNNPDPAFVTKTCDYLIGRLGDTMSDIERICYHGSGHGFLLGEAARGDKTQWGDINAFTARPIAQCNSLTNANEVDKEECREGVFNVVAEWMENKQYEFSLSKDELFAVCRTVPAGVEQACYYEMAQKSDGFTNRDPVELQEYVAQIAHAEYRDMAFGVGIAGIVQNVLANGRTYEQVLDSCAQLDDRYYTVCMDNIVAGLYEHGEPQQEYKKALAFCAYPSIAERDSLSRCYQAVAGRLPRFYPAAQVERICTEFPKEYRDLCLAAPKTT